MTERTQGGKPQPRRAEPLQPDKPGAGNEQQPPAGDTGDSASKSTDRQLEQSRTAVENNREGY